MRHPALVALLFALTLAVPVRAEEVQRYGASITETRSVALAKLVRKPRTYIGRTLRIEGTVKDVCQGQGCWLEVQDATGKSFLAKSLDESVLVPKDCKGRHVIVQGVLTSRPAKGHDHHEGDEAAHECPSPTYVLDTRGVELSDRK